MLVLDRILNRDDVPLVARIHLGDERRQRRGLARSGWTTNQYEPARQTAQHRDVVGEIQMGEARNGRRQRADGGRWTAALVVQVDTEPTEARPRERQIDRLAGTMTLEEP